MIAPLRRRHRWTFLGLAAVLPALVAFALLERPELPRAGLPEGLETARRGQAISVGEAGFAHHRARLRRLPSALELTLEEPLRAPDVLAYLADASATGEQLPPSARLLGSVSHGRANVYPLDAATGGRLILYSLGYQEVVDSAALEAAGSSP